MNQLLLDVLSQPWATGPTYPLATLLQVMRQAADSQPIYVREAEAVLGAARRPADVAAGAGVAVLPLMGTIFPRANVFTDWFGAAALTRFGAQFRQALADPNVSAIVLDVDSPGGSVAGVDEMATEIYRSRGAKPVVAVANHMAASAAYWIATAADELVVAPSAEVGSIGVFAAHEDFSQAMDTAGIKTTLISAGKYKVEGNPYEPLSPEARAAIQARVDDYYSLFARAVARQRGANVDDVRDGYGEGRVVGAREAVKLGMADKIGTLDETISRLQRAAGQTGKRTPAADLDFRMRRARTERV
jgi:capsid assembly protease